LVRNCHCTLCNNPDECRSQIVWIFGDPERQRRRKWKTSYTKISKFINAQINEENSFRYVAKAWWDDPVSPPKARGTTDRDGENGTSESSNKEDA